MNVDVKKKFSMRSDRVKAVDLHPTEPWLLSALYNGQLVIYNYETESTVRQWEVTNLPLRSAKFVARKQWVICGADDMMVRVYNYNTGDLVKKFEAHQDYLRALAVHPTLSLVLTTSDDMSIKMWDWDKDWQLVRIFEGHTHYVMAVAFNPKDPNTFASASLDKTVKVWGLTTSTPHFTLEGKEGHLKGVNTVMYYPGGDKPYLVSGGDDHKVKIWDYVNKSCVHTLEAHQHNVGAVCYHPALPLLVTASEDGSVILWNSNTYRLEKHLNYGWDRAWSIAVRAASNHVAVGFDDGSLLIKIGREIPAASMDTTGKVIFSRHSEIVQAQLRAAARGDDEGDGVSAPQEEFAADGVPQPVVLKELGASEVYPREIKHSPNGRLCAVIGDGEYTVYMAVGWRNKAFGRALEFQWGRGKGQYVTRETGSKITVFNDFKETLQFRPDFVADGLFGGPLIGIKGPECICFYDWDHGTFLKQIDVAPKQVYWSENGERVVIATDSSFFVLTLNKAAIAQALQDPSSVSDDGVENAFADEIEEVNEKVRAGLWVGDCFIYTNSSNKLNYAVGARVETFAHLDKSLYLLAYLPRSSRVFLMDKGTNIYAYQLHLATINYQTAVLRKDFQTAEKLLPKIPPQDRTRIAHFLESQGHIKQALRLSSDPDHRFDLALQLNELGLAREIAEEEEKSEGGSPEDKWKQLADLAMQAFDFELAEHALIKAHDLTGLLLLYSASGNARGFERLFKDSVEAGFDNIAFLCLIKLGRTEAAFDFLVSLKRYAEATFFARTYCPSKIHQSLSLWKEDLAKTNAPVAQSLAEPDRYPNLFPGLDVALRAEAALGPERNFHPTIDTLPPASSYLKYKEIDKSNLTARFAESPDDLVRAEIAELPADQSVTAASEIPVHVPPPVEEPTSESVSDPISESQDASEAFGDSFDDEADFS